jgi:hypothetical protein
VLRDEGNYRHYLCKRKVKLCNQWFLRSRLLLACKRCLEHVTKYANRYRDSASELVAATFLRLTSIATSTTPPRTQARPYLETRSTFFCTTRFKTQLKTYRDGLSGKLPEAHLRGHITNSPRIAQAPSSAVEVLPPHPLPMQTAENVSGSSRSRPSTSTRTHTSSRTTSEASSAVSA